jgi:SAM-dependent methyltransferase
VAATPNPPEFEAAVRTHLEPARSQFNYAQMLHTFLSVDRFRQWAAVVDRYRPVAGARFLSSGCGFGGSLVAYHDAGAAVAVGVDVDDDTLQFAALRTADLPGTAVVVYDGRRLPLRDSAVDIVESLDVIEHTPNPAAYLAELRRVLAPGGVVLLVTPNRLWPVEQHLGVAGPPWLPVAAGDALFGGFARLPGVSADRQFRYRKLRGMRLQNISLRRLRALAKQAGLFLRLLVPEEHPEAWPLPRQPRLERLTQHRLARFVTPTRTLAVLLSHD